jgi:TonB-linked SusC/RagA family outer membrane protein
VVVTAYGTQTKGSLTGSITEIKSEEFIKVASGNAITNLTGKVAGVQIYSNSGQPGTAPIIRFRGIGSLNGSSAPLYVVDGVPFNESITSINPNDIKSISFLKDASAAALYGNRGANGVVIVTTKKGQKGSKGGFKVNIDLKTSYTSRAVKDYNVMTGADEYLEAYHKMLKTNEILANKTSPDAAGRIASNNLFDGPTGLVYNPYGGDRNNVVDPNGKFRGGSPLWTSDWKDVLFNKASGIKNRYVGVNGGTENSTYFFSLGHERNEGYNINTGFDRHTLRLNIDSDVTDDLTLGISSNYSKRKIRGTLTNNIIGNFAWVRNIAPIYPVYAVDHKTGEIVRDRKGNPMWDWADVKSPNAKAGRPFSGFSNPHAVQKLNVNKQIRENFSSRAFGSLDLFNGFNVTYNFGIDLEFFNDTDYDNNFVGSATGKINGRLTKVNRRRQTVTNQQLLTWEKQLNGLHNIELLLGHETSQFESENLQADKRNQLISTDLSPDLFAENDGAPSVFGGPQEYNLEGFFGRVLYDFDNKYFVNGSFRRDGSSVFHPDNRWGNFYGAGVAWMISQEPFMKNVEWISRFKLKSSIGQQGNDIVYYSGGRLDRDNFVIRNYAPYLDQWKASSDNKSFELGLWYKGNKELKWETSTNFNLGFELQLFDNKLSVEAEYFVRKISDLISNRPLPPSFGLPSVPENVMSMKNTGLEVLLTYNIISSDKLTWTASINATHYKNKITKLALGKPFIEPDGTLFSSRYRWEVGRSAYDFFMRKFSSVNPENGKARWYTSKKFEADKTTEIKNNETEDYSHADEVFLNKSSLPKINGGLSTSIRYLDFDLSIDLSYQFGGYAYDAIYSNGFLGEIGRNFNRDYSKTWTYDNTKARLPRVFDGSNNYRLSDLFILKSDFISLNDVVLGYTIPNLTSKKIGVEKIRVYAMGNNLAVWTKANRQGFDPRQRIAGNNHPVRYPTLKTFSIGLNINF